MIKLLKLYFETLKKAMDVEYIKEYRETIRKKRELEKHYIDEEYNNLKNKE